jgi:hypothetical protein
MQKTQTSSLTAPNAHIVRQMPQASVLVTVLLGFCSGTRVPMYTATGYLYRGMHGTRLWSMQGAHTLDNC